MFAMPQHTYAYAAQPPPPPPPRQYPSHGTSSAFSSSANPDEDWTKISDLAERRRIQNRIAQRNYRKKLKRRLEDLERRAGKSDGTSSGSDKAGQQNKSNKSRPQPASKPSKQAAPSAPPKASPQPPFTPPMPDDEYLFRNTYDERERSNSPMFSTYSSYPPPPEDMLLPPYGAPAPHSYRPMTADIHPEYLAPAAVPVTLPPMTHFSDAIKREQGYPGSEESMYMSYNGYMPGLEMSTGSHAHYDHSNPHTPPLSHSFDRSASCSDSGSYEAYPTTPLSMPGSPCMV